MPRTSDVVNHHGSTTKVDAEYLQSATRDGHTVDGPHSATIHKIGRSASRRAESLAARIEEGAAGLAAFAEGLSDAPNGARLCRPRTSAPSALSFTMLPACIQSRLMSRE